MKESFEDLKTPCFFDAYKILDTEDYVLKELKSELNNETYYPKTTSLIT
jgi:hypothetical protein